MGWGILKLSYLKKLDNLPIRNLLLALISIGGSVMTTSVSNPLIDLCTSYGYGFPLPIFHHYCSCVTFDSEISPYKIYFWNIIFYILFWLIFFKLFRKSSKKFKGKKIIQTLFIITASILFLMTTVIYLN